MRTENRYFVSGVERPPFTTHQTKYTFSVSPSSTLMSKPPPSPGVGGQPMTPSSPQIPVRGTSSHEAVQSRTSQRDWSSQCRSKTKSDGYKESTVGPIRPKSPGGLPPGGIPPGGIPPGGIPPGGIPPGYQSYTYSKVTTRTREISPPPSVKEPLVENVAGPTKDNSK